eukprot:8544644-Pyramimonas_sp.AAC.1
MYGWRLQNRPSDHQQGPFEDPLVTLDGGLAGARATWASSCSWYRTNPPSPCASPKSDTSGPPFTTRPHRRARWAGGAPPPG